jgi:diguanylate cyclase (GGDEF)-like protein
VPARRYGALAAGIAAILALALAGIASLAGFSHDQDARRRFEDTELVANVAMAADGVAAQFYRHLPGTTAPGTSSAPTQAPGEELAQWDRTVSALQLHRISPAERTQMGRLHAALARLQATDASAGPGERDTAYLDVVSAAQALLLASVRASSDPAIFAGLAAGELARTVSLASSACALAFVAWFVLLQRRQQQRDHEAIGALGELLRTDPLTGVTNRRGLDESLPAEMARALRSTAPLTAVMIDLDFFKRYNSRRGHAGGDSLLRTASQRWRRQLRPSDLLARYGGEEFTLVLPECDADQAIQLVERLRPVMPDSQTFSAGIATWDSRESPADLLRRADTALLAAKKEGRNRTIVSGREEQISLPLAGPP